VPYTLEMIFMISAAIIEY